MVQGELGEHGLVGGWPGLGLLDHGQAETVEEDLAQLRHRRDVERSACQLVAVLLGLPDAPGKLDGQLAEDLGVRIAGNLVMIGFFTAVTGLCEIEAVKKAIPGTVPDRFLELNLRALQEGYEYGEKKYGIAAAVGAGEGAK